MINKIKPVFKNECVFKKHIVVTGHFGSGKTNVAVNLAFYLRSLGKSVTVADIDIVNPYFRSADNAVSLRAAGIRCIVPVHANTNVDMMAVPAELNSVFDGGSDYNILDVGGDDTGAAVLGTLFRRLESAGYDMLYVVNMYRPLIAEETDAAELMKQIEKNSRLRCTAIVNNSNLGEETDGEAVSASLGYADRVAEKTGLPLAFDSVCIDFDDFGRNIFYMNDVTKKRY